MIRLLLIRHAATDYTDKQTLLGATDAAASPAGLQELERLVPRLTGFSPQTWYCSPLKRAGQTAERMRQAGCIRQPIRFRDELREIDFGRWEGKTFYDIEAAEPDLVQGWTRYDDFVFPGGEAVADFTGRVRAFLSTLGAEGKGEVGVITHGGVIRTMICLSLGLDPRKYLLFTVDPASLTILDLYPEGGVLAGLNI